MFWRPVLAGCGTLIEIEEKWSITDLYDCHEALDVQAEAQQHARENAK